MSEYSNDTKENISLSSTRETQSQPNGRAREWLTLQPAADHKEVLNGPQHIKTIADHLRDQIALGNAIDITPRSEVEFDQIKRSSNGSTQAPLPSLDIKPEHAQIMLKHVIAPALRAIKSDYDQEVRNISSNVGYALANFFGPDCQLAEDTFLEWCTKIGDKHLDDSVAREFWDNIKPRDEGYSLNSIFKEASLGGYPHALKELVYGNLGQKLTTAEVRNKLADPNTITAIVLVKKYLGHQYFNIENALKAANIPFKQIRELVGQRYFELFGTADTGSTVVGRLLELTNDAELYRSSDNSTSISVVHKGVRENYMINSPAFQDWLIGEFYRKYHLAPDEGPLKTAVRTLDAKANADGALTTHFIRVGRIGDKNYIDMCDEQRRVIEFDKSGWRILDSSDVSFIRYPGMLALPEPKKRGDLRKVRELLNIKNDGDFVLVVSFLLSTMLVMREYPILNVTGAQNTAKSSFARTSRDIVDFCVDEPKAPPKEELDYYVDLKERYIGVVDNISYINQAQSDMYCRIATGGTITKRKLYTDAQAIRINIVRPQIFTGINNTARSGDLASRCLHIELEEIAPNERLGRDELQAKFNELHAEVLGALLDIIVQGLNKLPNVELPNDIDLRMPDFVKLAIACEQSYGMEPGSFLKAYGVAAIDAADDLLDGEAVFIAIAKLLAVKRNMRQIGTITKAGVAWTGTCQELLDLIQIHKPEHARNVYWPENPRALGAWLRRNIPPMKRIGCIVRQWKDKKRMVLIEITNEVLERYRINAGVAEIKEEQLRQSGIAF